MTRWSSTCSTCCTSTAGICGRAACSTARRCSRRSPTGTACCASATTSSAQAEDMRRNACRMGLEGIICKRADAPYRGGRGRDWLKVKCQGREEFVVLGWTPPGGSRIGIGALHLGFHDPQGAAALRRRRRHRLFRSRTGQPARPARRAAAAPPPGLLVAGDPLDPTIRWVRPELVVEVQFISLVRRRAGAPRRLSRPARGQDRAGCGARRRRPRGRARSPSPRASRPALSPPAASGAGRRLCRRSGRRLPSRRRGAAIRRHRGARAHRKRAAVMIGGVELTHPDRELWPGITKHDLADYWEAVAEHALPGIAHRPLARACAARTASAGEHFFQKHGHGFMPPQIREGEADGAPYLAIDDAAGLVAMAQMSAIELHAWGAGEADPLHPDHPGLRSRPRRRRRLRRGRRAPPRTCGSGCSNSGSSRSAAPPAARGCMSWSRCTPQADWDAAGDFCRAFAEMMSAEQPDHFLSTAEDR